MPLRQTVPSDAVKRALREDVADYMESNDPAAKTLLTTSFGLRVFTLRVDTLEELLELAELKESFEKSTLPAGWRFMAVSSSGLPIAGDVIEPEDGSPPRMTSLSRDAVIADMVTTARRIERSSEVQAKDYDLRLLRIPGVLTEAFWLKPWVGDDHLIIPILTKSKRFLPEKKTFQVADFLPILKDLADEYKERSNAPGQEGLASV